MEFHKKYLKYKNKYLQLKNMMGGDIEKELQDGKILIKGVEDHVAALAPHELTHDKQGVYDFIKKKISIFLFYHKKNGLDLRSLFNNNNQQNQKRTDDEFVEYLFSFILNVIDNLLLKRYNQPNKDTDQVELIYNNIHGLSGDNNNFGLWYIVNGNDFEKSCNGKTWLTIDKYYVQFLFFTTDGYLNFTIYADPKGTNFDDPQNALTNKTDIYIKFTDIKFNVEYKENLKVILEEKYKSNMDEVINYMYKHYITKQNPFIAFLGKARFWAGDKCEDDITEKIRVETQHIKKLRTYIKCTDNFSASQNAYKYTKELYSNLLFRNCNLGFISGGYSGVGATQFGITRSGYEMAKKYEKPIVTIMCNAGRFDKNEHSDATGFYGMHWSDDTRALSTFADAAIMIAPFGAWSQIELFYLSYKNKPCSIYFSYTYTESLEDYFNKNIDQITEENTRRNLNITLTNIHDLFMTKFDYLEKDKFGLKQNIGQIFTKKHDLGSADIYGIDILFNNMYYDKGNRKIKLNQKMDDILTKFSKNNKVTPYTIWYPHYIKDTEINEKNGIPVFINYRDISNYTLNKLKDKSIIQNKIRLLDKYVTIPKKNFFKKKMQLTLNRNLEKPFNEFTGSYEKDNDILIEALDDDFDRTLL